MDVYKCQTKFVKFQNKIQIQKGPFKRRCSFFIEEFGFLKKAIPNINNRYKNIYKLMNMRLHTKYLITIPNYNLMTLNKIFIPSTLINIRYKELQYEIDNKEYLNKYYYKKDLKEALIKLVTVYHYITIYFPLYLSLPYEIYKIILNNKNKKQKFINMINDEQNKKELKNWYDIDNDDMFNLDKYNEEFFNDIVVLKNFNDVEFEYEKNKRKMIDSIDGMENLIDLINKEEYKSLEAHKKIKTEELHANCKDDLYKDNNIGKENKDKNRYLKIFNKNKMEYLNQIPEFGNINYSPDISNKRNLFHCSFPKKGRNKLLLLNNNNKLNKYPSIKLINKLKNEINIKFFQTQTNMNLSYKHSRNNKINITESSTNNSNQKFQKNTGQLTMLSKGKVTSLKLYNKNQVYNKQNNEKSLFRQRVKFLFESDSLSFAKNKDNIKQYSNYTLSNNYSNNLFLNNNSSNLRSKDSKNEILSKSINKKIKKIPIALYSNDLNNEKYCILNCIKNTLIKDSINSKTFKFKFKLSDIN